MKTTKVQIGEPVIFIGIIYRNIVKGYLQEQKWLKTAASPKPTWAWGQLTKSGNLERTVQPPDNSMDGKCPIQVTQLS